MENIARSLVSAAVSAIDSNVNSEEDLDFDSIVSATNRLFRRKRGEPSADGTVLSFANFSKFTTTSCLSLFDLR